MGSLRTSASRATFFTLALVAALGAVPSTVSARSKDSPWLFISDLHYRIHDTRARANFATGDTDVALFDSLLAQARAVDPNPPVVVIAGDFIAHHARPAASAQTMAAIARAFDRAFPRARFVIALGNNDSACGDYAAPLGGAFLRDVARAWAPLVNRDGAAPGFASSFARDGSYVARLPVRGLRVVVTNDDFASIRYDGTCAAPGAPARELAQLRANLVDAPAGSRNWVLFHIPPGVDAYSTTQIAHQIVVVPFLQPTARDALLRILGDPRARVALAIAGHTHRFAFRIAPADNASGVPMLLVPSISPIYQNAPSFLAATVTPRGTLGDVTQYAFDGVRWRRHGDYASLGVRTFDAPSLRLLERALFASDAVRERFTDLYGAGGLREIGARNWRAYVCAASHFTTASFETCVGDRGVSVLTSRGVALASAAIVLFAAALFFGFRALRAGRPAKA